jgi:uncharacterized protein YajQ (UPF0234 family)
MSQFRTVTITSVFSRHELKEMAENAARCLNGRHSYERGRQINMRQREDDRVEVTTIMEFDISKPEGRKEYDRCSEFAATINTGNAAN